MLRYPVLSILCLVILTGPATFAAAPASNSTTPAYKLSRLPSGRQIKLVSMSPVQTSNKQQALMLRYNTDLKISARDELAAEADDIWDRFKADAERGAFNAAVICAEFGEVNQNHEPAGTAAKATPVFNFLIAREPGNPWRCLNDNRVASNPAKAAYSLGVQLVAQGQYNEALALFNKCIAMLPRYAQAYSDRGGTYLLINQADKALADCNTAINLNPENPGTYTNRGIACLRLNQYGKAVEDLTRALTLNYNPAIIYKNRGLAYLKTGDYERAVLDLSRAINIEPDSIECYSNRALALSKLAAKDQEKCAELERVRAKLAQRKP